MEKFKLFVCTWGIFSLIISCSTPDSTNDQEDKERPNFLLLISDNHYYKHLSAYGDPVVETPNIDQIADQGVRFTHAFAAPTCTPARGALLAGQNIWRLGQGANLWSTLSDTITIYTDILEENGYMVGHEGKGWGPGDYEAGGRERNPAGYTFDNFEAFLDSNQTDKPWSFWLSSSHPHRPFDPGSGIESGMDPDNVEVPPYLPDVPEVRSDICDYYYEIQQFDQQVAHAMELLEQRCQMENTVIMVCADNGWMMPRGLANLYDFGTRVPLIISWPKNFQGQRVVNDFVSLNDLAPTILQLAGLQVPEEFTAKSLLPVLESEKEGRVDPDRDFVVTARERHAISRENGLSYPARAIRTDSFLLIHNLKPDRWPAGDPPLFGDIDAHMLQYYSPTKEYMMEHKNDPDVKPLYEDAFLKRPELELFNLEKDPYQMNNVAEVPEYQEVKNKLHDQLKTYRRETGDPRILGKEVTWDDQPYYHPDDWVGKPREEAQEKFGLKEEYPYR